MIAFIPEYPSTDDIISINDHLFQVPSQTNNASKLYTIDYDVGVCSCMEEKNSKFYQHLSALSVFQFYALDSSIFHQLRQMIGIRQKWLWKKKEYQIFLFMTNLWRTLILIKKLREEYAQSNRISSVASVARTNNRDNDDFLNELIDEREE